jgi:hypothetical protein
MKTPGSKFAMIALIFAIVWTLLEHFMGYNTTNHETGQYTRMVGSIVFYAFIFVAILKTKKDNNGTISFAGAFKVGAIVSLVYSLGVSVWYAIYGELINTDYKPTLMAFERAQLVTSGASAEAIESKMKQIDLSSGGSVLSYVLLFVFMFLTGLVITAILSLIFKSRRAATI